MLRQGQAQFNIISQNARSSNQELIPLPQMSNCHGRHDQVLPKKFYIFGNIISHSMSPTLHSAGFKELGLPHHYSIYETPNVDTDIHNLMAQPDFGGASVTFPHKLQIGKFLSATSESAKLIGAVNTVVVREVDGKRVLIGDNTDWLAIKSCIESNWTGDPLKTTAVVIGAGGTARAAVFALQELGVGRIDLVNRTLSRSNELANDFPAISFSFFDSFRQFTAAANIIVACIPADDITEDDIPLTLFGDESACVLVEMAYRPRVTALMKVAMRFETWKVLQGTDVLKEQAYHQFSLWTGHAAPISVMIEALERDSH
jgi:shikimate-5-dehydrogenase